MDGQLLRQWCQETDVVGRGSADVSEGRMGSGEGGERGLVVLPRRKLRDRIRCRCCTEH